MCCDVVKRDLSGKGDAAAKGKNFLLELVIRVILSHFNKELNNVKRLNIEAIPKRINATNLE